MSTFSPQEREQFIKDIVPDEIEQRILRNLGNDSIDFLMEHRPFLNGEVKELLNEPNQTRLSLFEKQKKVLIDKKNKGVTSTQLDTATAQPDTPALPKNTLFEQLIFQGMKAELAKRLDMPTKGAIPIKKWLQEHFEKVMHDRMAALYLFTVKGIPHEEQQKIEQITLKYIFFPLFGDASLPKEKPTKKIWNIVEMWTSEYQEIIFPESTTMADERVRDDFKATVLTSKTNEMYEQSQYDREKIMEGLTPYYEYALEDLRIELLEEM